jgi:hypothetical protein
MENTLKEGTYVRFTANKLFGDTNFKVVGIIPPGEATDNGERNASKVNLYRCVKAGDPYGQKYLFLESQLTVI